MRCYYSISLHKNETYPEERFGFDIFLLHQHLSTCKMKHTTRESVWIENDE